MNLAFCLFKYFPYGGLQRDFLRIAEECLTRGHHIDVYTMEWEGPNPLSLSVTLIPKKGFQNHSRSQSFVAQLQPFLTKKKYDLVIGFNKMPGLDVYYAADTCYRAKACHKHAFYRLTPRYRHLVTFEKAVFHPSAKTQVLLISPVQQHEFVRHYQTPAFRFHLLPPGIAKDRIAPANANEIRSAVRQQFSIKENEFLLLMVGSGFKTKGLDRVLTAFAHLPENLKKLSHLFIVGKDNAKAFVRQAKYLNITNKINFLGGREDVPHLLLAADLLLHPAYNENTGTVLLEALVAGLPVLTTDVCGYAHYITDAKAGYVLPSPFQQKQFNETLQTMLLSLHQNQWQQNALTFAQHADIYSLPLRAVDIIEQLGQ